MALAHQNLQVTIAKVHSEALKAYRGFAKALEQLQIAGELARVRQEGEQAAKGPAARQAAAAARQKAELEYMKAELGYRVAHAQLLGVLGHP